MYVITLIMDTISNDTWSDILSYLHARELWIMSLVSRKMRDLVSELTSCMIMDVDTVPFNASFWWMNTTHIYITLSAHYLLRHLSLPDDLTHISVDYYDSNDRDEHKQKTILITYQCLT